MKLEKIFLALLIATSALFTSCKKDTVSSNLGSDFIAFGHFHGFCAGEQCIEIFKITNLEISEDQKDEYPPRDDFYKGNYQPVKDASWNTISDLVKNIPDSLWTISDPVIGCPDCADQGGFYIEVKRGGDHRFWLIDKSKSAQPEFLKTYTESVAQAVAILSQ